MAGEILRIRIEPMLAKPSLRVRLWLLLMGLVGGVAGWRMER